MLEDTLKWRSNYKPEEIRWVRLISLQFLKSKSLLQFFSVCQPEVAQEGETGKAYRANFKDKDGRTVIVMTPAKQV